jgi:hypothetical protein
MIIDKIFWGFVGVLAFQWGKNYLDKKAKNLSVRFTGVQFANRNGLTFNFNLGLDIENKNNFSIPNLQFRGGVYVQNRLLFPVGMPGRVTIPQNGKTHVDLLLPIDYKIILNLWNAFPEMKKSLSLSDFKLIGDILMVDETGGVLVGTSINESFTLELNKLW